MRSFPRVARRTAVSAVLVAAALGGLGLSPSSSTAQAGHAGHAAATAQRRGRLHRITAELASAERTLSRARSDLHAVQHRLAAAERRHDRLAGDLTAQQGRLADARDAVAAGDRAVEAQREQLRDLALDDFSTGDPRLAGFSGIVSGDTDLSDLTRVQAYDTAAATKESNTLQRLDAQRVLLGVRREKVASIRDRVAERAQAATRELREIRSLRTSKAHQATRMTKTVRRLSAVEKKLVRRIVATGGGSRQVAHLRGSLLRPVRGPVTSPFGMRIHPIEHVRSFHDGDDFGAPCGTPVHAVETGRVVSAYDSPVWGRRLFLSLGRINGRQYTAVYNHLARYAVKRGSVVDRGDVLGYAGQSGWATGCHLHLTLLRDGRPVDPLPYL